MARSFTIAQIKQRIRKRADMISTTGFYPDADLLDLINETYAELYDTLVSAFQNYYTKTTSLVLTSGTVSYALPADFYKLITFDVDNGSGSYTSVFPFQENERNSALGTNSNSIPNATLRLRYIPTPAIFTQDSDTIDGVSGWESLLITDCAIAMLDSEESDTSALERRRQREIARITSSAQNRDISAPGKVSDVTVFDNAFLKDSVRYRIYGNNVEFITISYIGV